MLKGCTMLVVMIKLMMIVIMTPNLGGKVLFHLCLNAFGWRGSGNIERALLNPRISHISVAISAWLLFMGFPNFWDLQSLFFQDGSHCSQAFNRKWFSRININLAENFSRIFLPSHGFTGWWQLQYFSFSPRKLGKMNPFWRAYFSKGLVQPPTSSITKHPPGLGPQGFPKWMDFCISATLQEPCCQPWPVCCLWFLAPWMTPIPMVGLVGWWPSRTWLLSNKMETAMESWYV